MPDTTPTIRIPEPRLVPLSDLHQADWNANRVPPDVLAKVRRSLTEFGIVENLVARPHPDQPGQLEVLSGNHRLGLYRELGLTQAPVVVVDVDDAHARVLAQTLNRTRGADDREAYAQLLTDVLADLALDEVIAFLPETEQSITQILDGLPDPDLPADPDDAPEPPENPTSKPGEVYELGPHRLICGDSTDPAVLLELMAGDQADLLFTDPPYGVAYRDRGAGSEKKRLKQAGVTITPRFEAIEGDDLQGDQLLDFLAAAFAAAKDATTPQAAWYVWHASRTAAIFEEALGQTGYEIRAQIIWAKTRPAFNMAQYKYQHEPCFYAFRAGHAPAWYGDRAQTTLWEVRSENGASYQHPTQKPVQLAETAIRNSCKRDGVVLDVFGGSGSTLVAAERLGRRARIVELDPRYCDVIRARYEAAAVGVRTEVVRG